MRTRPLALFLAMLAVMGTTALALANFVPALATVPTAANASPVASSSTSSEPGTTKPAGPADTRRVIYLTFDDGPDPRWTPQVLRILARHNAKATFFMLGQNAAAKPGLVDRVRRDGHAVANHTWSHPQLTGLSPAGIRSQLERTSTAIGGKDRCMRPPYGATNAHVASTVREGGRRSVLWDVDTNDWRRPGVRTIEDRVVQAAKPGAVMLMHDAGGDRSQTVGALDGALTRMSARGYTFRALPSC